jgi:hypothetical protein
MNKLTYRVQQQASHRPRDRNTYVKVKDKEVYAYTTQFCTREVRVTLGGTVEVTIDIGAILADITASALLAKTGRSTKWGGWVKAKAVDRKVISEEPIEHPLPAHYELIEPESK